MKENTVTEFESHQDFWNFSFKVQRKNRYLLGEFEREFLKKLVATSETRRGGIRKGAALWRAQVGYTTRTIRHPEYDEKYEEECPYPPERMLPLHGQGSEGRANPVGIAYLYLSNKKKTAMAEVRPWLGAPISLALFEVKRDLKVIDCSSDEKKSIIYFKKPEPKVREGCVWASVNEAFSKPINPNDPIAQYVPTQIIAELFRAEGFDGIVYKSSLEEEGHNVVLFDFSCVRMVKCTLYKLASIGAWNFKQSTNDFFVKEETQASQ